MKLSNVIVVLPRNYGWVAVVATSSFILTQVQSGIVAYWRKRAHIPYPQAYAEKAEVEASIDAKRFNCAHRAHANTLEQLPHFLFALAFAGIRYPRMTAGLGATWILGRSLWTVGYITGEPKRGNDLSGNRIFAFAIAGLQITSLYSASKMIFGQW